MKYLIVMRTFDRSPMQSYMHKTMGSLIKSGLFESKIPFEFHLFDGGSPSMDYLNQYLLLKNIFIHSTKIKITKNENWLRSIEHVKEVDCDYVIQLEDDILVCDKWLESIDAYLKKHESLVNIAPMVSFYAAYQQVRINTEENVEYWGESFKQFYGTQCILFKKDIALKVVKHIREGIENIKNYPFKIKGRRKDKTANGMIAACIDLWLQEWGMSQYEGKWFLISCPSFVQHIGKLEGKHLHQSHFLGEDWSYI